MRSHLIQSGSGESSVNHDKVRKSFHSLFSQKNNTMKSNGVNYMEMICPNCSSSLKNGEQMLRENEMAVQMVQLKPECLNYLQSFQIINKFLIKMFFFPRESHQDNDGTTASTTKANKNTKSDTETTTTPSSSSEQEDLNECCKQARKEKINKLLIDSFDEWVKDLFVISCCSTFISQPTSKQQIASYSSRLFEFQSITINTIIELINLSESVNARFQSSSKKNSRHNSISFDSLHTSHPLLLNSLSAAGNKSIVYDKQVSNKSTCLVQTVFTNKQIDLIFNHSEFGNIVAKMLWSHLSSDSHISNMNVNQLNSNNLMSSSNSAFSNNQLMVII